jgi:glycosyltransferase involved in cell wall biosynthesis
MTDDTKVLTVITPVYNGARHIERCARNVLDQDCPGVEHLVIDGGSDDGTVELLDQLGRQIPTLRWVSEPDRGQSDAMNKGHTLARGRIIGVLNADDYYEPGVLRRIIELFQASPDIELFIGACNVREPSGAITYVNRPRITAVPGLLMGFPHPVNPTAYFYRASVSERVGGFDVDDHYSMDIDFLYRALAAVRVRYVDEVWGNFVTWPEAKTTQDKAAKKASTRVRQIHRRDLSTLPNRQRLMVMMARPVVVLTRKTVNSILRPRDTLKRYMGKIAQASGFNS